MRMCRATWRSNTSPATQQATAAAFARAKYVSKLTVESQRLVGNPLEPRACIAAFDAASGKYTLHLPLQGAGGMRGQLGVVTGVAKEKLDIVDAGRRRQLWRARRGLSRIFRA